MASKVPNLDKFVTLYPKDGGPPCRMHRVDARDVMVYGLHQLEPVTPTTGEAATVAEKNDAVEVNLIAPSAARTLAPEGFDVDDIGFIVGLSGSAVRALRKAKINTVADLRAMSLADLELVEGLSGKAFEIAKEARGVD